MDTPSVLTPVERKMRIISSTSLFFFLISCVLSLQFPATVDKRIRKTLIDALKRFQRNDSAPRISKPVLSRMHKIKLDNLPMELMNQEVGPFLDFKSMINLRKTSINSKALSDSMVKFRLAKFCRHFVFDDLFLNDLLLFVLDEHFPESSNLSSPSIKDELQVLILKFNFEDLNFNAIPHNIYFYLISFINEFVNGPNSTVPVTYESCIIDSMRLVTQYESPKTLKILKKLRKKIFLRSSKDKLNFFASRPTKEDVATKFGITDINVWWQLRGIRMDGVLLLIISEYFVEDFTTEGLVMFCKAALNTERSIIITDRLLSVVSKNEAIKYIYRCGNVLGSREKYSLCVRYPDLLPDCELILKVITVITELPLEDTAALEASLILMDSRDAQFILNHFAFCSYSNLYQAELFSLCVNSPHISFDRFRCSSLTLTKIFWDIYLKENPRPFKNFYGFGTGNLVRLNNIYHASHVTFIKFFESLNSKDPIVLMFILSSRCLIAYSPFILDKFDLNKSYHFCMDIGNFDMNFDRFIGRTLHFKQIIKEMNDPELQNIFSSNPHEFDGEFLPSEPIIDINRNMSGFYFKSE